MLERQQNLKRLSIRAALLVDVLFEVIERNCKNLEFLKLCSSVIYDGFYRTNVHIGNKLIIKNMVIKQLRTEWKKRSVYFPRNLIQACNELVSLNMESKLFHFVICN